jgi:hypothetical protein
MTIKPQMQAQLEKVKLLHNEDLAEGFGEAHLPDALARKLRNAARELVLVCFSGRWIKLKRSSAACGRWGCDG